MFSRVLAEMASEMLKRKLKKSSQEIRVLRHEANTQMFLVFLEGEPSTLGMTVRVDLRTHVVHEI